MKTIIVTGSFGLVGSNFIRSLPKFLNEEVELIKVKCDDLSDCEIADYIVHGAGYGQPLKFTQDKIKTIEINTKTTIELFKYLKPGGTFLYVSSSEVYSGNQLNCSEDEIGNTTPSHPRACYIEGKRCGEAICHSYRDSGYNVKIARLALAYGPGTKAHDTRVINQFIEQGFTGNIVMRDGGEAIRTYLYIQDAVELLWNILLKGKDVVYNVGGFSTLTILELAEEIGKIMNATVTLPEISTGLKDAPQSVNIDMSKTLKEFDRGFTNLSTGLRKTIEYQKKFYE